ncbi:Disease resistance-responsive family protein [Hibiscus syriacus]|uniref:Dirigent protein n=1 Tax=Hibiscus syriacus TaxID=106335 RepID=A0A6A3A4C6_HIBSY|nr:Disease resistance-responsive family protein [Hibiscus syriacus]
MLRKKLMERSLILAWILVLSSATAQTCCHGYYSDSVPYVPSPKEVTRLHFFLHDTPTGENTSAVLVARPNTTTFPDNAFMPLHLISGLHVANSTVARSANSVFSRNPITETRPELTVVGGRGKFRLEKGFAQLKTYSRSEGSNAVVQYNVTLFHH